MAIPDVPIEAPVATGKLDKFFFESLPGYFKVNDSYVVGDEGLLERYLKVFQTESEQYVTDLETLATLPFPALTQARFLNYIGKLFGSPPDTFGDTDAFSDLLDNIVHINKNRGTTESLQNFFKVMGTDCTIAIEHATYYLHDDSETHDDSDVHHDGYCYPCASIIMDVLDPGIIITELDAVPLTQNTRRMVQSILSYFLPINAILKTFKYNGLTKSISLTSGNLIPTPDPGGPLPA